MFKETMAIQCKHWKNSGKHFEQMNCEPKHTEQDVLTIHDTVSRLPNALSIAVTSVGASGAEYKKESVMVQQFILNYQVR